MGKIPLVASHCCEDGANYFYSTAALRRPFRPLFRKQSPSARHFFVASSLLHDDHIDIASDTGRISLTPRSHLHTHNPESRGPAGLTPTGDRPGSSPDVSSKILARHRRVVAANPINLPSGCIGTPHTTFRLGTKSLLRTRRPLIPRPLFPLQLRLTNLARRQQRHQTTLCHNHTIPRITVRALVTG
ncbi:hypothetical protein Cob_v012707 [Colletotrichum orbiculare MAFF 240422]|uniref:Uncharacterized protein n=1 Tax=Colletotrichum orbiculare (strain 104-T / ATCC 96160 / CBS 514.97 / LARS 414 / MAFF 240422) TaxID=1213857 RepID=A0A484F8Z7_COLOR|nr:hypothetical protein Cob_v012707 [Colletotrichum orbiculare MAFF 240422]